MEDNDRSSFGSICGKRALFEYQEHEKGQRLIWREAHDSNLATKATRDIIDDHHNTIAAEDIIVVTVADSVYHILMIEHIKTSTSSEQTALGSEYRFQSLTATNLPLRFLDTFLITEIPTHLTYPSGPNNEENIHILISTGSGTGRATSFFDSVLQPTLAALNISNKIYRVHHTCSAQTISELTRSIFLPRAQQGIPQTLILLSGDGGVHDIVDALLSSNVDTLSTTYQAPIIGLLALGTGNALAHSLGFTKSSTSLGLRTFLSGTPRPLPVFRACFSPGANILTDEGRTAISIPRGPGEGDHGAVYGVVVLSYGLHASLVAESDTPAFRKHGSQRFQIAAQQLLFPPDGSEPHAYKAKLSILKPSSNDKEEWIEIPRQEHAYILTTLVSNLEEKFKISPLSRPIDGKMYLVHFGPMSGDNLMHLMSLAYQDGKHIEDESVGYEEVEGVRIELLPEEEEERWRRVCVDGTIVRLEKGGWVEVRKVAAGTDRWDERVFVRLVQP